MPEMRFRAPGRVEISGNHTDHQRGRVLAAAVNLDMVCTAKANGTQLVRITSPESGEAVVDLSKLSPQDDEKETTSALIRGVASWFRENGYKIGGFDASVKSDIPVGVGLSSSAAFEVLIGNIFNGIFGAKLSDVDIAVAGQYAENHFFGKPSGLMDQTASSCGGLLMIDFFNPSKPEITAIEAEIQGYEMCVVVTGDSHENMTDEYAAIAVEMKSIAEHFNVSELRDVEAENFFASINELRKYGDRAVLRAMHFFNENERVALQANALRNGRISDFLLMVNESGRSSLQYLQNVYNPSRYNEQGLVLALALCEQTLGDNGAYRVHGGGFAGSILVFVPEMMQRHFNDVMSSVFGTGCCHFLRIQKEGGGELIDNHYD